MKTLPDNRKPLKYGAFPVCRNYTVRAHLRNPGLAERHRCKNRVQYAGAQQCRIYPRHLHPRHEQGAGTGGGKDGKSAEAGALTHQKQKPGDSSPPGTFLKIFPFGSNLGQRNSSEISTADFTVGFDKAEFVFRKQSNNSR